MVGVSKEVVGLIYGLLPGFVAAWIYYGLTAHRKQSPFERAVHALILTAIIRSLVIPTRAALQAIGSYSGIRVGQWTSDVEFVWSIVGAIVLGHFIAWVANTNKYHAFLDKLGVTKRTSYPSEWFGAFARHKRFIILHIDGGRRIQGWPFEWPDQPDAGHFALLKPSWLLDDNTEVAVEVDELFLIPASSVEFVEFLKFGDETVGLEDEIAAAEKALVALQRPYEDNAAPSHRTDKGNEE